MLKKVISLDKHLFLFLNNLGSNNFDGFWLFVTKQSNWTPFFLVLLFLVFKKIGWKKTLLVVIFIAIILTLTDQGCNFVKHYFQRLRPCNNTDFSGIMRVVKPSLTFSFFSGHAANSSAVAVFLFLIMRNQYRFFGLIIIWPLVFAYSRIYLGLHYPVDILTGYLFGSSIGTLACFLFKKASFRLKL